MTAVQLLAHQGGWDEILLVVGPLALVAGLLWLANRRISDQLAATESDGGPSEDHDQVEGSTETDPRS